MSSGMGIHAARATEGVARQLPSMGSGGVHAARAKDLRPYFNALAARLRRVKVTCGDWARVVTRGATCMGATVGVFLDPPYALDVRDSDIYRGDAVREWALERGSDRRFRIVLAGYAAEHEGKIPDSWTCLAWKAGGGYGLQSNGRARENRTHERLWLSPHCLTTRSLFD